eukprot:TRINITY_DN81807_c0_g1_i1.p1 TRINITY_DN81807_c0_g1~~TRINITY_DN81807_c0_g1_i1.p1  ORF type:complete len:605 (+),score=127.37 TRINITY_DN81807_c0_g1_i1:93-1907(+)
MARAETPPPRRTIRDTDVDDWTRSPASRPRDMLKLKAVGSETKTAALELMGPDTTEKIKKTIALSEEGFMSPKLSLGDVTRDVLTPNRMNTDEVMSPTLARGKENWQPKAGLWSATPAAKTPSRMATVEENVEIPTWVAQSPTPKDNESVRDLGIAMHKAGLLSSPQPPGLQDLDCSPPPRMPVKNTFIQYEQFLSPGVDSGRGFSTPRTAPPGMTADRLADLGLPDVGGVGSEHALLHALQTPCWADDLPMPAFPPSMPTWPTGSLPPLPGQQLPYADLPPAPPAPAPISAPVAVPSLVAEPRQLFASEPAVAALFTEPPQRLAASAEESTDANRQQSRKGDIVRLFDFLENDLPTSASAGANTAAAGPVPTLPPQMPPSAVDASAAGTVAPWMQATQPPAVPLPSIDPCLSDPSLNHFLQAGMPMVPTADPFQPAMPPATYGAEQAGMDQLLWQWHMQQYMQTPPAYQPQAPMPAFPAAGTAPAAGMPQQDYSMFAGHHQAQSWCMPGQTMPAGAASSMPCSAGPLCPRTCHESGMCRCGEPAAPTLSLASSVPGCYGFPAPAPAAASRPVVTPNPSGGPATISIASAMFGEEPSSAAGVAA